VTANERQRFRGIAGGQDFIPEAADDDGRLADVFVVVDDRQRFVATGRCVGARIR
jgi:hypothetical protein